MTSKVLTLTALSFAAITVSAGPAIRVPVVLEGYSFQDKQWHKFVPSEIKEILKKAKLKLPDYALIDQPAKEKVLEKMSFKITEAGIGVEGIDSALSLVGNGKMASYEVQGKSKFCYVPDRKMKSRENAENAFSLYTELNSYVLAEEHAVIAVRYFDETAFDENDGGWGFTPEDLNKAYASKVLEPGAAQIIVTTSQHGEVVFEEILTPCKK